MPGHGRIAPTERSGAPERAPARDLATSRPGWCLPADRGDARAPLTQSSPPSSPSSSPPNPTPSTLRARVFIIHSSFVHKTVQGLNNPTTWTVQ